MFRAKLRVIWVKDLGGNNVEVLMRPVMGDNDFTPYTPTGEFSFICTNPTVNEQLKPGLVFPVTFGDPEPQ